MSVGQVAGQAIPNKGSDMLALGFGTTVAMWAVAYLCRLPAVVAPSPLLMCLLLACLVGGGFVAGRHTERGVRGGLFAGLLAGLLNLLVLGSLLSGERPNQLVPSALWWIPGSIAVAAGLGALGAALGRHVSRPSPPIVDWTAIFVRVAGVATLLLLVVGGLVTSSDSGLAVVDWPNSFGYSMFLYPLSRMTGGVYYEHAHRLFGSLVGLTTLVLALHLRRVEERRWVCRLAVVALAMVIVQGILGGLRVTGRFTLSSSGDAVLPNIHLAVIHAVLGQVFFATLTALAAFTSSTWKSAKVPVVRPSASVDRALGVVLMGALVVQLVLGAFQRHLASGLLIHVTLAVLVSVLAIACGVRAWGLNRGEPILRRTGVALMLVTQCQLLFGVGALIATSGGGVLSRAAEVMVTTTHQATGAILLAVAVLLASWNHRLLQAEGSRTPDPPRQAPTWEEPAS